VIDKEVIETLAYMAASRRRLAAVARRDYDGLRGIKLDAVMELENAYLLALQTYIAAVAHNAREEAESIPQ